MEVSREEFELSGPRLIHTVVSLVGLPESPIRAELDEIIQSAGQVSEDLTLLELRLALMQHLDGLNQQFLNQEVEFMSRNA